MNFIGPGDPGGPPEIPQPDNPEPDVDPGSQPEELPQWDPDEHRPDQQPPDVQPL